MKRIYDYWLCSIPGVGNRSIEKLLAVFDSAEQIYGATEEQLAALLYPGQLEELKKLRSRWDLQKEYDSLRERGITFLTGEDDAYPRRLKNIPDAPIGIFYKGTLPEENCLSVAIIGARDCSEYGKYVARELGKFLGRSGVQVISGMARGIDGISQEAALSVGGTTTAVLGSGVDICYPKQNKALYEKILQQGCILSTYPPGTMPRPQNFPPRNRIVSGLADVIVVIEARNKSGTLITVDMALEQGKEVYVIPGRITDRLSDGCNRLLKQGAGVLLSPEDFLEEIREVWQGRKDLEERNGFRERKPLDARQALEEPNGPGAGKKVPQDLQAVYALLDFMPKSTEQLLTQLRDSISISELNIKLMKLCVMGLARQESPGYFLLK